MSIHAPAKLVVFANNPRTIRDVLRLASPRFEVIVVRAATAALAAAQSAGVAVLVAEYQETPVESNSVSAAKPCKPGAVALLEAARIRCPAVRRVLLANADLGLSLIPILHGATAQSIVPLPIVAKEFIAALLPSATGSQSLAG